MTTTMNNHVRERGTLPEVEITNWGTYLTLSVNVGHHTTTSFMTPAEGQSIDEFIYEIRAAFANLTVDDKNLADFV